MIRVIALTENGLALAQRLVALLCCDSHPCEDLLDEKQSDVNPEAANAIHNKTVAISFKPKPFAETVQGYFEAGEQLIFVCATGIVMRTLAPVIQSKLTDPPVLVLDEKGQFVIPLLAGHEGGANHWASQVAALLNAQAVITSACEYLNPVYTVGMGCERDCPIEYLETLLQQSLDSVGLTHHDIAQISSIDIKSDEQGLIDLAARLNKPFTTWGVERLRTVEGQLSNRSDYVFKTVGVYGVAESAALVSANQVTNHPSAELILTKQKNAKATCAIARAYPAAS